MAIKSKTIFKLSLQEMSCITELFQDWNETMIWSCLQGYMGNAYVSEKKDPSSAQIIVGDFCYFAGTPDKALAMHIPADFLKDAILMIPQNEEWSSLLEQVWSSRAEQIKRYAIKKEPDIFDEERLQTYIQALPEDYSLYEIDEKLYNKVMTEDWSRDLCSAFNGYEDYQRNGIGIVVLHQDNPVAGASSYTVYNEGIEIEIDTQKAYRRKGLALACGAKLILECLNRGLYPSWDAYDMRSVALAEKLGYHLEKEYIAYVVNCNRMSQR